MSQLSESQYIRAMIKQFQGRLREITEVDPESDTETIEAIDPEKNVWGDVMLCIDCLEHEPCRIIGDIQICEPCYEDDRLRIHL